MAVVLLQRLVAFLLLYIVLHSLQNSYQNSTYAFRFVLLPNRIVVPTTITTTTTGASQQRTITTRTTVIPHHNGPPCRRVKFFNLYPSRHSSSSSSCSAQSNKNRDAEVVVVKTTSSRNNTNELDTTTTTTSFATKASVVSFIEDVDSIDSKKQHQQQRQQTRTYDNIWMFRNVYPISYDRYVSSSSSTATTTTKAVTKILLLNGFGMGTFHQHRLMNEMMNQYDTTSNDDDSPTTRNAIVEVYAMDYLGQGKSWPILDTEDNTYNNDDDTTSSTESGLQYSAQTWLEQIIQFIEQVILLSPTDDNNNNNDNNNNSAPPSKGIHLVGNSLGGYLASYVAATRPDLIASLILLNATPIWGLDLPGWSGYLPVPILPKIIGHTLFDIMRSTKNIQQFLNVTYVHDPTIFHPTFVHDIQSCTNGPYGHDAFASILWSPPLSISIPIPSLNSNKNNNHNSNIVKPARFVTSTITPTTTTTNNYYDCVEQVQCNVFLCYGQNDPWCKPAFAKEILQRLQRRQPPPQLPPPPPPPQQQQQAVPSPATVSTNQIFKYVELSNVGHCPNHEAPIATAKLILKWLRYQQQGEREKHKPFLINGQEITVEETWGPTIIQERNAEDIPLSWIDQIAVKIL